MMFGKTYGVKTWVLMGLGLIIQSSISAEPAFTRTFKFNDNFGKDVVCSFVDRNDDTQRELSEKDMDLYEKTTSFAFKDAPLAMRPSREDLALPRVFNKFLACKNVNYLRVTRNARLIGLLVFSFLDNNRTLYIQELAIDPAFHKSGIGKRLILAPAIFLNHQVGSIILQTYKLNSNALAFYGHLGFKPLTTRNACLGDDPSRADVNVHCKERQIEGVSGNFLTLDCYPGYNHDMRWLKLIRPSGGFRSLLERGR